VQTSAQDLAGRGCATPYTSAASLSSFLSFVLYMRVAAVSSGHCSTSSLAPASGQGQPGFCCEKKQEVRNSKRPCRVGLEWSHSVCRRPCQRTQRMFAHRTGYGLLGAQAIGNAGGPSKRRPFATIVLRP